VETSNYLAVCFFVTEKLYTRGCNSLFWLFIGGWNIWDVYSNTQQHINKFVVFTSKKATVILIMLFYSTSWWWEFGREWNRFRRLQSIYLIGPSTVARSSRNSSTSRYSRTEMGAVVIISSALVFTFDGAL